MKTKDWVIVGIVAWVVLAIAVTILGVASIDKEKIDYTGVDQPVEREITRPEDDKFESRLRGARQIFIDGCTPEGASYSQCACMYDKLDSDLTNDEFEKSIDNAANDIFDDHASRVVEYCAGV